MLTVKRDRQKRQRTKFGTGIINSLINKLPFELHLPGGYQYCGPGTKLHERLARGDPGINGLDKACKQHDIAYLQNDLESRHKADYQLEQAAWNRVKSKDAGIGERAAAWLVTNIMKGKQRFGMGCKSSMSRKRNKTKQRKVAFGSGLVSKVRDVLRKGGHTNLLTRDTKKTAEIALRAARRYLKLAGGKRNIRTPRIIPIPKVGGILPLIPIFAGLSALGSIAGTAAGIAKAVNDAKASREQLAEANRHNRSMESIAMGRSGSGIYLKQYRKGMGLYLKQQTSKN